MNQLKKLIESYENRGIKHLTPGRLERFKDGSKVLFVKDRFTRQGVGVIEINEDTLKSPEIAFEEFIKTFLR